MQKDKDELTIINTDRVCVPQAKDTLRETRFNFYQAIQNGEYDATIFVLAYGRIEKTRQCVENILRYTDGINFELVLVDNGSDSDILEYFQTVQYEQKKIIKITKNIGSVFGMKTTIEEFSGKYFVLLPNDVVVTAHWLANLLQCLESDPSIGYVTPVSSNVSNLQQVDLKFHTYEQMQEQAARFNVSDPRKWEERLRLINIVTVLKKEVIDNVGYFDAGFFHDFTEDDYAARVRRAGYKIMLCGDTWVHHDHDFRNMEDKDPKQFQQSLEMGRQNFREKYYGLDAWDDINNYELGLINMLGSSKVRANINILGIETRCGTPILQIRNWLRRQGMVENIYAYAFTTQAKYYEDLLFAADGHVACDRINYLTEHYPVESMDYIIVGEPVNLYDQPISLVQAVISLLKKGGKALLKLRNTADVRMLLHLLGLEQSLDAEMPINLSVQDFSACLKAIGVRQIQTEAQGLNVSNETINQLKQALKKTGIVKNVESSVREMCIEDYLFCVER